MDKHTIKELKFFPTSTFILNKVHGAEEFNKEFCKYIYKLKEEHPDAPSRSDKGINSWHSPDLDLDDPIITKFVGMVDPVLESIINRLGWDLDNYFIGYKEIWSIINKKGDYNMAHTHGDALLSLAYYVKKSTPSFYIKNKLEEYKESREKGELEGIIDNGCFYFKDPRTGSVSRKPPIRVHPGLDEKHEEEGNIHLTSWYKRQQTHMDKSALVPTSEGALLIFPGWMEHGVTPNTTDNDRIVISANINLYPKKHITPRGSDFQPRYIP